MIKTGHVQGKCPQCGKTLYRPRPIDYAVCDCWQRCPLCEKEMMPYNPSFDYEAPDFDRQDFDPVDFDGRETIPMIYYKKEKGFRVVMVCLRHSPPYYSKQLPMEVRLK